MEPDRPLLSVEEAVAGVRADLEDQISTILARLHRRPVGDVEETLRGTPKPGTLILNGQVVSRTTYADLWKWANEQGLVPSVFTIGDGSTTFGLPDYRGRVMRGTPAGEAVGLMTGADSRVLTVAQMPAHDHNVTVSGSTNSTGSHSHSGVTDNSGVHSGHNQGAVLGIDNPGGGLSIASSTQNNNGGHTHSFDTDSTGGHSHTVSLTANEATVGAGAAVDMRQASFNGNWLIWC